MCVTVTCHYEQPHSNPHTPFMQFTTKNGPEIVLDISYAKKFISKAYHIKCLGIYADSTLSLKIRIEQITHKLRAAGYAVRSVKPYIYDRKH